MSVRVTTKVWESERYELGARLVLRALAAWCDDAGNCWPKVPAIAKKTRLQVQNILSRFKSDGTITVETGGGRGKGNRYRLDLERVQSSAPFTVGERVQSLTERVQSSTQKGCNPQHRNKEEPSVDPLSEPSGLFDHLTTEPQPEKPNLPSQSVSRNPNCPRCTDGIIFVNVAGMPKARPYPCRFASQPGTSVQAECTEKPEAMAASA